MDYREILVRIALANAEFVLKKDAEYGGSWKKRGGHSAAENLMRKIDRISVQLEKHGWDVFVALGDTTTGEALIDTLRDLVGYAQLIEAEMVAQGKVKPLVEFDDKPSFCSHQTCETRTTCLDWGRCMGPASRMVPRFRPGEDPDLDSVGGCEARAQ